jgi:peptidoglycan-associated lipoprotein
MNKHAYSRIWPVLAILVIALALFATGCKKKAPKETPPPPPPPAVEKVETPAAPDTTGQAARLLQQQMDTDRAAIRPVYFDYDKSDVRADQRPVITANADILRKWTTWQVTVEGNCDERGTSEYNLALGERRAAGGKQALIAAGVDAARINTVSYGKEHPVDPGHTEAAWGKNRRDEFKVK